MNNVISVNNSPCDTPRLVALRLTPTVLYHTRAALHCTLGTARAYCSGSKLRAQQYTGNCVTDTHRLCTTSCLLTGAVYWVVLRHVTTSYSQATAWKGCRRTACSVSGWQVPSNGVRESSRAAL